MKFIFFGTPEFAAIILEKLINADFIPEAVVCNPDKPVGRKKIITAPAVKLIAQKYNIPILQPEKLEIGNWKLEIGKIKNPIFDFFIVAAYSKLIPKEILKIPRLGAIGIHPSLLPKYRGATPIQTAILNGDEITGTTLYLMDEKMDHGAILASRELNYELRIMNYEFLMRKLAELSADLLIKTLPDIEKKIKNAILQDELQAIYTKKFKTEDAFIKPEDLKIAQQDGKEIALKIEQKIRALNPEPGVWTIINPHTTTLFGVGVNGKRIKLLEAQISDNKLKLIKIQIEGKKPTTLS
ncbi:MAG: methionyl-tRNA formyltransferase [Patescibacteria group bacterium]